MCCMEFKSKLLQWVRNLEEIIEALKSFKTTLVGLRFICGAFFLTIFNVFFFRKLFVLWNSSRKFFSEVVLKSEMNLYRQAQFDNYAKEVAMLKIQNNSVDECSFLYKSSVFAHSLSSNSMILCLQNFISRLGMPTEMYIAIMVHILLEPTINWKQRYMELLLQKI